ncbi:MAG: hypothetical protein R2826_03565 [Thermoleophilia bacterium]
MLALTSAAFMVGVVLLVVFLVAIIMFATTGRFGEAALALVAGVLAAFSVDWTSGAFIAFMVTWSGFFFVVILIASIKLAARSESIYGQAAVAMSNHARTAEDAEEELRRIGADRSIEGLGPIERAEVLRLFAFRQLPADVMLDALKAVVMLTVITQIGHMKVAVLVADAVRVFAARSPDSLTKLTDSLYGSIKESAVPPADFIAGFESARYLILSGQVEPVEFLSRLTEALENGVEPQAVAEAIARRD